MSEEQTNFKVTDRRLFNSDGTPRDVPEEERPTIKPTATASAADAGTSTEPPAPADTVSAQSSVEAGAQTKREETAAPEEAALPSAEAGAEVDLPEADLPGADDPASFASFLMSIASNAASSLGMMEHPVTGKRDVDLELGKHWIDVLGMLQQKTRGNLLPQEQQILEGLLADLRMQFVSLTNATPPKARTFSSRDIVGG